MNNRQTGWKYEEEACNYLISQGYQILERNYQIRTGEIDVIARDKEYLVFVEVKYRKSTQTGDPLEAVNLRKQKKIIQTARHYLYQKKMTDVPCRFDVIGISGEKLFHIKNAFELR